MSEKSDELRDQRQASHGTGAPVKPVGPLWEFDHPFCCSESNHYSNECYSEYGSWESFIEEQGALDFDLNLVFRWDWKADVFFEENSLDARREYADRFGDRDHAFTLSIFWIGQRKGVFRCTNIKVCKANEPVVREWLTRRAEHMRLLWEPLIDATTEEAS